jgi:hypothetical protein
MLSAPTASFSTGREVSVPGVPIVEPSVETIFVVIVVIFVGSDSGTLPGSEFVTGIEGEDIRRSCVRIPVPVSVRVPVRV